MYALLYVGGKMKHIHHVQQSCDGVGAELEYVGGGRAEVINEGANDIDGGHKEVISMCMHIDRSNRGAPVEMPSLWSLAVGVASLL